MTEPTISESDFDQERAKLVKNVTQDAANYLRVRITKDTPVGIVAAVNQTITDLLFDEPIAIPEGEEYDLLLGCLWGSQVVRALDWKWVNIHFGDALDVAVVSPSRDMAIFPFTFVAQCLAKQTICTVLLSFNMLLERKDAPVFEPGSYENVMAHVQHIVPPYTLEPES